MEHYYDARGFKVVSGYKCRSCGRDVAFLEGEAALVCLCVPFDVDPVLDMEACEDVFKLTGGAPFHFDLPPLDLTAGY
ncbi:MAG: hypothetical protein JEY79_17330 [Pseudodesulfovibrio sp.]|nr:hypothetical protein [Pseudodesulfovibrio sp.]